MVLLAHGNSAPQICVRNLLSMARGECPYERCKGLDPDLTDSPFSTAAGLLAEDVAWIIDNYEPRVTRESVGLILHDMQEGIGRISAEITVEEG